MAKIGRRVGKTPPRARRKTLAPTTTAARRNSVDASLRQQLAESRAQQAATAEILKVISRSPAHTQPVFEAIVRNSNRLIGAVFSILYSFDGKILNLLADSQSDPKASALLRGMYPAPARRDHIIGRAVLGGREVRTSDIRVDARFPANRTAHAKVSGYRAALVVPLLRDGAVIGALAAGRLDTRAFSRSEIGLLRTFADQAVIAIENVRLFNETKEALERQTATAEILKVIARSPTDVTPVFEAIVRSACDLCGAEIAAAFVYDGRLVHLGATHNWSQEALRYFSGVYPSPPSPELMSGRTILAKSVVTIADATADEHYDPKSAQTGRWRRMLGVPLLRDGSALGAIVVCWREPGQTPQRQIDLLQTFADQAVIAIENVRLFNETKEALERQTATAEILKVIASSPSSVQPVFDAIARSAMQLVAGFSAAVVRVEGDMLRLAAFTTTSDAGDEALKGIFPLAISGQNNVSFAVRTRAPRITADIESDPEISEQARTAARARGWRAGVAVPMLRDGLAVGAINVTRRAPGPFSDHHVKLLQTFADQAVIAIENARLFNETSEALERQTATSDVLRAISTSPSDTQPVFDVIAERAVALCGAKDSIVLRFDGTLVQVGAQYNLTPEARLAARGAFPCTLEANGAGVQAIRTGQVVEIADVREVPHYQFADAAEAGGVRRVLAVPLLRAGQPVGAVAVGHGEPGRFSSHQVRMVQTFADQAVIAIENVRLFNETREALQRQTATAEILKVIASSPSDVRPVFEAITKSAADLFAPCDATITTLNDGLIYWGATAGTGARAPADAETARSVFPLPFDPTRSPSARAIAERRIIEILDSEAADAPDLARLSGKVFGFRSGVFVPLIRENEGIGTLVLTRPEPGFQLSQEQLALVRTFADQAVIAIENVRLFNETKESLERQTATAEILKVIASSPADVQPVFDAIVRSSQQLFGAVLTALILRREANFEVVAAVGLDLANAPEDVRIVPLDRERNFPSRAILDGETVHITDWSGAGVPEHERRVAQTFNLKSGLIVPLLREGTPIGSIGVLRQDAHAFDARETALLRAFADQAVIAIENVRLFNETKEALERQTATAEILKVISSSPTSTQPVFDAIVNSALRLFNGHGVGILLADGEVLHLGSVGGAIDSESAHKRYPMPLNRNSTSGQAILDRAFINIADSQAPEQPELLRALGREIGYRSVASAPMLREGTATGAITVMRKSVGAFSEKEVALLKTFADQAVIAIENVRLFKELQSRTEALTKSVGQLTALGEVGQAISSTLDLETVLRTIVARAVQLSDLDAGVIYEYDPGMDQFLLRASERFDEKSVNEFRGAAIRRGEGAVGRSVETREPVQIPDTHAPDYPTHLRELLDRSGFRALLAVPLLREDQIIGALMVIRRLPGEFAAETVAMLKTFAGQSALAIQNARLFREIAEKGKQLEEASRHKSNFLASMSHELRTPLNAILGFNEMILGQVYGEVPADMQVPLADIQASGKHLLRLINNVLDLAKIEAGRMELSLQDYSVHDTVASVHSTLRPLAAEKGLEFLATVPNDVPLAYGDGGRMAQCLINLAGNSLKFTKAGKVEIVVELKAELLVYRVADTGIGIPPDKIGSLFTEFKQTDATIASEYGGTGLGLSISRKFVEMHGGRIRVESEMGKGSTFIIEVPLRVGTP